jgi:hypothetical protein
MGEPVATRRRMQDSRAADAAANANAAQNYSNAE